jgi:hypothetical protein
LKWSKDALRLAGPDDFVRLDRLCAEVLGDFFAWLQSPQGGGISPEAASQLAHAADRYLRDFVVDILESGPADPDPTLPRRYLGNWYIVNTLTPTHEEIDRILEALCRLYLYLEREGVLGPAEVQGVLHALEDGDFFHRRLEAFWDLKPEGVGAWREVEDYRVRRPSERAS